jgi:hypothetical protein
LGGYPGNGRRVELEEDLSRADRPELVHAAFMGDAVLILGESDISPRFGWITLLDWCLRLAALREKLAAGQEHTVRFAESEDYIRFQRHADQVIASCSYTPVVAHA